MQPIRNGDLKRALHAQGFPATGDMIRTWFESNLIPVWKVGEGKYIIKPEPEQIRAFLEHPTDGLQFTRQQSTEVLKALGINFHQLKLLAVS